MARNCRICSTGCDSFQPAMMTRLELEGEIRKLRIIGTVKSGDRISQAGWRGRGIEKALVEKSYFRRNRKVEGCDSSHVIPVNMHDMEIALDPVDEGIEHFRNDIDVMEFDGHCDDIFGMTEQVVEDPVFAAFNVHLHENLALGGQAAEDVLDGRAIELSIAPNPLPEVFSFRSKKTQIVEPRKDFPQRVGPELQDETQ